MIYKGKYSKSTPARYSLCENRLHWYAQNFDGSSDDWIGEYEKTGNRYLDQITIREIRAKLHKKYAGTKQNKYSVTGKSYPAALPNDPTKEHRLKRRFSTAQTTLSNSATLRGEL